MKQYLVEYIDPKANCSMTIKISGSDKTDARDRFWAEYPEFEIERITWIPNV